MARWKRDKCPTCRGYGLVTGAMGEPTECTDCEGAGILFITEHDRCAAYPGGPFSGSWPGRFAKLDAAKVEDWD